jgi:hypothetical protein
MTVGLGLFVVVARREFGRRVRRGVGGSCVVLPLSQLLGEEVGVVDDLALGDVVELFGVDAVGSFHFAVQPWRARFDADVVDAFVEQIPVKRGAEFGAIAGIELRLHVT